MSRCSAWLNAWETTDEDVLTVLDAHAASGHADQACAIIDLEMDRVAQAALRYTDFDDQAASAFDEIETILIEQGLIGPAKRFACRDAAALPDHNPQP